MNALGIVSGALGKPIPEVGLTTFRMPYTPVTFGAFAGLGARRPVRSGPRRTPMHGWAAAQGAVFEDVGLWKRARYFPRAGEDMHAAVARECRAVRERRRHVRRLHARQDRGGRARTPPTFMNRMYVNAWTKLGVGRCRYGLMLREDGFVTTTAWWRASAPDRFHVTTTTGGAAARAGADGGLPADRVAGTRGLADLDHRAVGGDRACRGRARAACWRGWSRASTIGRGAAAYERRGRAASAACRRACSASASPASSASRSTSPPITGAAVWEAVCEAGQAARHHPLRHRGDARAAGREGLHHRRPGNRRHGDAGRRRPRLGGRQEQAGLRRQALARPRRHALGRAASSSSACSPTIRTSCSRKARRSRERGRTVPTQPLGHVTSSYFSAKLGRPIALAHARRRARRASARRSRCRCRAAPCRSG